MQQLTFAFTERQARYVRIVGHGKTANDWTSVTETDIYFESGTTEPPPGYCDVPADVLDLDTFKVQLPTGSDGAIDEGKQPALNSYSKDPWFVATSDSAAFGSAPQSTAPTRAVPTTHGPSCGR